MNFIHRLIHLFRRRGKGGGHAQDASPDALEKVLRGLEQTRELEITCEEVLAVLDQVAEAIVRGDDVARLIPLVQHHLDMCADCQEELEALLRILRTSPAT